MKRAKRKRDKKPMLNVSFDKEVLKGLWYHDEFSIREYLGKPATDEDLKKLKRSWDIVYQIHIRH